MQVDLGDFYQTSVPLGIDMIMKHENVTPIPPGDTHPISIHNLEDFHEFNGFNKKEDVDQHNCRVINWFHNQLVPPNFITSELSHQ